MSPPTVTIPIEVPMTPNFVRLMGGGIPQGSALDAGVVSGTPPHDIRRASSVSVLEREDQ